MEALSYYTSGEVKGGTDGSGTNRTQVAAMGIIVLVGAVVTLWGAPTKDGHLLHLHILHFLHHTSCPGYIQDEFVREARRIGKAAGGTHRLKGDGLSSPINVEARHTHTPHILNTSQPGKDVLV
eukprot:3982057-Amphidinium_carterae.2